MSQIKSIFLCLILALAACRSVPQDVITAHEASMTESALALGGMNRLLAQIENAVAELDDAAVVAAKNEWRGHVIAALENRATVEKYTTARSARDPRFYRPEKRSRPDSFDSSPEPIRHEIREQRDPVLNGIL